MDPDQTQLPSDSASYQQLVLDQWKRLKADQARYQAIIDSGGADPVLNPDGKNSAAAVQVARNALDKLNSDERAMLPYLKPGAQSQSAPTTITRDFPQPDGTTKTYTYRWNPQGTPPGGTAATGAFELDTSVPVESKPAPAGAKPPSDPSKWQPIHSDPSDPNSPVIALQDPTNSSNRVAVPAGVKPDKPQLAQGPNGSFYSWDGSKLTQLQAGTPEKRQIVQGPNGQLTAWDGQKLEVLQPGTGPKNGDTMQDLDAKGYPITKTYQNGQWGITSTAAPGPPTEGKTRPNIENGFNVTQTFTGGDWTTTSVGSRAIPEKPTQVTASTTAPYEEFIDSSGNVTQRPNANFMPKTLADVAARRGQLQTLMQAKSAEVQGNVGKTIDGKIYTSDDALRDYNKWHAQQIDPQISGLEAAQQAAQFEQAKEQATMRTAAQTAATAAGKNAIDAANAYRQMNPVGPGFREALNQMSANYKYMPKNLGDLITYTAPNPMYTAQQQSQEALKYIDPTAAAASGLPPPNLPAMRPEDLQAALGAARYAPKSLGEPPTTIAADPAAAAAANNAATTPPPTWTPPGGSSYVNAGPAPWTDAVPRTLKQQYPNNPELWGFAPDYLFGG